MSYEVPPESELIDPVGKLGEYCLQLTELRDKMAHNLERYPKAPLSRDLRRRAIGRMNPIIRLSRLYTDLERMTLGHQEKDIAADTGRTVMVVKDTRKRIKRDLGTLSRGHTTAVAIQRRIVPVRVEVNPAFTPLTEIEEACMRLTALGYTMHDIGELTGLNVNTVDRHFSEAHDKTGALNLPHGVRRTFELGIFGLDEDLEAKTHLDRARNTQVWLGRKKLTAEAIGILHPAQLTLLDNIAARAQSSFKLKDIIGEGEMVERRGKRYRQGLGRTFFELRKKLDEAAGRPVIKRIRKREGQRDYLFYMAMTVHIGPAGSLVRIERFDEKLLQPAPKPKPKKTGGPAKVWVPPKTVETVLVKVEPAAQLDPEPAPEPEPEAETKVAPVLPARSARMAKFWADYAEELRKRRERNLNRH